MADNHHGDIPDSRQAIDFFRGLQQDICDRLEAFEPETRFYRDTWQRAEGGGGDTRVIADGEVFERGGVNFSHVTGHAMPPSATQRRPELAGRSFTASGVSLVIHPRNPYAPTAHANVRIFVAEKEGEAPVWWFGGGLDLTPYYPFMEDTIAWHQACRDICTPFGADLYPRFKQWCDDYFYLPHRDEARGVGGLFFDDFNELGFADSLDFVKAIGHGFMNAYEPILEKRRHCDWGDRERDFQLFRRGRYVEFNLLFDRGTLFGIQSRGRTESILVSMPPLAAWKYNHQPEAGSPEAELGDYYLKARDWLADNP